MKNELQIDGYWWLPSIPDNKIAGTFYNTSNQYLKVFGSFYPNDILSSSKRESPSIILGEDEKGNKITLIEISKKETRNISGLFSILQYQIQYCIKGIHLNSINDLIFNEIEFRIESLTSWKNYYPVKHSIPCKNDKLTSDFNLSYSASSEEKVYELGNEFELSINHRAYPREIHKEEIIVTQYHIASIKSKNNKSFTELLDKAYRFKFFLNMAAVRQNDFLTLNLYSNELNDGAKTPKTIELFFNKKSQNTKYQFTPNNKKYLFYFDDVEDIFPELIKKWFSFDKEMMPIIHHLVNSLEQKNTFNSTDFLIIVQALEGYHRRFVCKKQNRKTDLKDRLQALADLFNKEIPCFNDFKMQNIANTRNYYSHFYKKEDKVIEGVELYHVTSKLRYLLICCLLKEIGIEVEKIKIILEKHLIHF